MQRTLRPARGWVRDPAKGLRVILEPTGRHERRLREMGDAELAMLARGMRYRLRRIGFIPKLETPAATSRPNGRTGRRAQNLKRDRRLERVLAFSGRGE